MKLDSHELCDKEWQCGELRVQGDAAPAFLEVQRLSPDEITLVWGRPEVINRPPR
jgi:hypothetical protein